MERPEARPIAALELRIPPPVVFGLAAALMWLIARALPGLALEFPGRALVAGVLAAAGVGVDVLAVIRFLRTKTTVNPLHPERSTELVTTGVYAHTRNPMYLGLVLLLLAWGVYLAHAPALIVIAAFVAYLTRFQIQPEERALAHTFGLAFEAYRQRVRRWL